MLAATKVARNLSEAVICITEECLNSLAVSRIKLGRLGLNLDALCLSDPPPGFSQRQYSP
jgi:hypothetical protein